MSSARIQSGKLRHVIEIQIEAEAFDEHGEVTTSPATVDTWRADISPLVGRESMEAGQVKARITHRIRMRPYDGLTTKHRIKFGDRILNIVSVADVDERGREMVVMAIEEMR